MTQFHSFDATYHAFKHQIRLEGFNNQSELPPEFLSALKTLAHQYGLTTVEIETNSQTNDFNGKGRELLASLGIQVQVIKNGEQLRNAPNLIEIIPKKDG